MDAHFPKLEEEVLEKWKREKTFEKSVARRRTTKRFVFYEGPPTANGRPGIHHVLSRSFKDIVCRYKTMRGFLVERKAGWDTHGLAVEIETEKRLGLESKKDIEQYGIEKFNAECKKSVWEYKQDWENLTERIGFWIDMTHPYITYETSYIETLWHVIKRFWDKGLLYKDYRIVPYCSRCGTSLSSHEVAQGYKTVKEPAIYVKFQIPKSKSTRLFNQVPSRMTGQVPDSIYILAWTTTPWTLPANIALAVNPGISYVLCQKESEYFILAKDLASTVLGEHKILRTLKGKDLVGLEYLPLFRFGKAAAEGEPRQGREKGKKIWEVVPADFVAALEGTGIVHTAVAYGEDDFQLGKKENLAMFHLVDEEGKFTQEVTPWRYRFVKDADPLIVEELKTRGLLFKTELHEHEYPFCWRCSTPLLYYAKDSWFLNMQKVKDNLLKNSKKISWFPAHIKEGRFGEWLKEVRDWAFSRERYWGTPLPVWECVSCKHREVIGSVKELLNKKLLENPYRNKREIDLHRPFIDRVKFSCSQCKKGTMQRVKEVVDVWFDSGSMPFAQGHWPFAQNPKSEIRNPKPPKLFPADYIVEGVDQTRGWFYTLLAVSTLLGFHAPYKNAISLGHVLDEKGEKMSKSKRNIVNPWDVISKYGIDAVRWYFFTVNNPGDPKLFSEKDVQQATRSFLLMFWNCFVFYNTYKPKAKSQKPKIQPKSKSVLDSWILSKLQGTIQDVTKKLDSYDITGAGRTIQDFVVNDLSLWYIRRSRQRAQKAASVLRFVLSEVCKLAAPFIPFLAEHIFQELGHKKSVHWESWSRAKARNVKLETQMIQVRDIVAKALALRAKAGIKVRQPLSQLKIKNQKLKIAKDLLELIKDEINVKEVVFDSKLAQEAELDTVLTPKLKEEGLLREIVRSIQGMRKEAGYKPFQRVATWYSGDSELCTLISKNRASLKKSVGAKALEPKTVKKIRFDKEKEIKIENKPLWLGIRVK